MKVKDLILKADKKKLMQEVQIILKFVHAKRPKAQLPGYEKVFEELLVLKPTKNKATLIFENNKKSFHFRYRDSKGEWGLDFVPWAKILGMQIVEPNDIEGFVAKLLWAITFYGFNQDDIEKELDKFDKIIADLDKGIEPSDE